ncbi:hypothetical protein J6590_064789 [Homalodisca vitripennis]|nr:hypothetical protein J6590_064789 [Homalodisca vitripennis]
MCTKSVDAFRTIGRIRFKKSEKAAEEVCKAGTKPKKTKRKLQEDKGIDADDPHYIAGLI